MTQEEGQKTTAIKYVYIEMIHNMETRHDVVAGLFKGIIEHNGKTFILVHGLENATSAMNTDFYNVMSLEVMEDNYKNLTFFTASEDDQEKATKMVEDIFTELKDAGYTLANDGKVIAITRFVDVPDEYLKGKAMTNTFGHTPAAGTAGAGVGQFANRNGQYRQSQHNPTTYTKTVPKKDPEPTVFGRTKTKKPNKEALDLMIEKIDAIKSGATVPAWPDLCDEKNSGANTAGKSVVGADDDDYEDMYGYYRGAHGAMC
jgi:hypothetical protein